MRVITEAMLRDELRRSEPETYYVPDGMILSPAGREYLQQRKIKIGSGKEPQAPQAAPQPPADTGAAEAKTFGAKYRDYETGALYMEKPEYMTQLEGDMLVVKNHPRIAFRGKLDTLQAMIVEYQTMLAVQPGNETVIGQMEELLSALREIMRADALGDALHITTVLGLTSAELRARSHDPMKFYHVKYMRLPDYKMGLAYALINRLRAAVREAEVAAVNAFKTGPHYDRQDILEIFNRLSSALHIMMCMYLEEHKL